MRKAFEFEKEYLESEIAKWELSDSEKGQFYTRSEVVEFMLTAIGLNTLSDLEGCRILEPSCGEGDFVTAIVSRIISLPKRPPSVKKIAPMLLAVDMVGSSLEIAKNKVANLLKERGYSATEVSTLLDKWFLKTDFLQENLLSDFTHVIGNPPYVRIENIPKLILEEYRKRFSTMTDRADLYIPFYEKGLSLLKDGGRLSFICTDRWHCCLIVSNKR